MKTLKHILVLFLFVLGLGIMSCNKYEALTPVNAPEKTLRGGENSKGSDGEGGGINDADDDEDEESAKAGKDKSNESGVNDGDEDDDEASAVAK